MISSVIPLQVTLVALLLLSQKVNTHGDFAYDGAHGPLHWGDDYHTCIGKHQSPINIEEHDVRNVTYPPLRFSGLDVPRTTEIKNNGHTVMLVMNMAVPARIFGGPLDNGTYVFEQMHFHWGENDSQGSEDLINNHSFAMELHAVFFKEDYKSMTDAVLHSDGLVVLAYFFEADENPNPVYESIVTILPKVEAVESQTVLEHPLRVGDFLVPKDLNLENYFTYSGSLTTPPCSEVVTWIDFKEPLRLSHKQIAAFRGISSAEGHKLTHNFRPVQPLEDRIVFHNIPFHSMSPDYKLQDHLNHHQRPEASHSDQHKISASIYLVFLALSIILK